MNINSSGIIHRCFHSFSVLCKQNHYDALGLTPNATQGEIKSAYYKLSMLYHPDKNKGSEKANEKFKDITAAYEVLGSFNSRRMYDRGLSGVNINNMEARSRGGENMKDFENKGSRIQTSRGAFTGRTPIYDFDEWSRVHYGQMVERKVQAKAMYEKQKRRKAEQGDQAVISILFIFMMTMLVFSFSYTNNLDEPLRKPGSIK